MKQRILAIGAIAVIALVGVFLFDHATDAQRPDRGERGQGQRGNRQGGGRGMGMGMMSPTSIVDNSWIDLTFTMQVDDETLVKARPVYQATRDKFTEKMEEMQGADDMRAAMQEMQTFAVSAGKEFQAGLKEVLTEEQMTKLNELTKKRQTEQADRVNRFRGEGGRRGGGGGARQ